MDVRHGLRMLTRNAGFTVAAVLALGLGIGVNDAVFTAYKKFVARPLDARDPDEMVNLALIRPMGARQFTFSYPDYEAYRDSSESFSGLIGSMTDRLAVSDTAAGRPFRAARVETAVTYVVSENYFRVLGVNTIHGRTFDSVSNAELVASPSVLISENYWQRRYAGDPSVLGRAIRLNGAEVRVIGVTPRNFVGTGMGAPDVWLPMSLAPLVHADDSWLRDRDNQRIRMFGRLAPGVSAEQAQAEMTLLTDRLRPLHDPRGPSATAATAIAWPGSPTPLPLTSYPGLILAIVFVMSAAAMVLIVACANVGSLQLARASTRVNELHTRASLGATRLRIVRQLVTENALLGLLAGAVALAVTWALLRVAVTLVADLLPPGSPTLVFDVTPDLTIFTYVFAVSVVASLLFGVAPAIESSRTALEVATRIGTSSAHRRRLQDVLIAAQVSLSLVLLIVGSMMVRGAVNAISTDPGYDNTHLAMLDLQFPEAARYSADRKDALVRDLRARMASLPGIVATTNARPPATAPSRTAAVALDRGATTASRLQSVRLFYAYVEANYFQTVGIPFALGRGFASSGSPGNPGNIDGQAVVLSESAARDLWPGQNPVGRSIRLGATDQRLANVDELLQRPTELVANGPAYEVVGVVRDVRGIEFDGSGAKLVYLPMRGTRFEGYPILVRTLSDPALVIKAIDPLLSSIDADVLGTTSSLAEMYRQSGPFLVSSLSAAVASTVGVFGLLLASMGIYGTVSYVVLHRTREIGIRMALGATSRDVLRLILGQSARPVVAGLMLGSMLAVGTTYVLRGLLYGLRVVDGVSFVGVSLLLMAVALVAAFVPARRASAVDPTVALRNE
jgi:macrolide transport system ATP-binding/permease protein